MRFCEEIVLIDAAGDAADADGYAVKTETRTLAFADVKSVRRSEFYESMRAGVKMAAAFEIRACDYSGQQCVAYDGRRYQVERTYTKTGEMIELNCSEIKKEAAKCERKPENHRGAARFSACDG